jgi:protein-disulfide isomerase
VSQKAAKRARAAKRSPQVPPPPTSRGGPLPRRWLYVGIAGVAAVVAVVLVLASVLGGGGKDETPALALSGDQTAALLDGIPQDGVSLGSPEAPVVLVEFVDMQCPFCQKAATDVLPALIDEYVRPGDVRIVFSGLAFIGADSEKALRAVLAAGDHDKLWNVADLLFLNQGEENKGWVTDELLRAAGTAVTGLDVERMLAAMDSEAVSGAMAAAAQDASAVGANTTPAFFAGLKEGQAKRIEFNQLEPGTFRQALDDLLGR